MRGKALHAVFDGKTICETDSLYQYDYGQILVFDDIVLPDLYEVLFSNGIVKEAKTVIGTQDGVVIPDEYVIPGCNIMAWIFLHDDENSGETEYIVRIPVKPRSKLSEEDITDEEHSIVSDLIAIVRTLREQNAELTQRVVDLENRTPALGGWKTDNEG